MTGNCGFFAQRQVRLDWATCEPATLLMRSSSFALSAVTFFAFAALPAFGQTAAPLNNFLMEDTIIHSGMGGQFEAAQRDYCAAVVKGGAPACLIFSTATFGQSDRYLTLLPFASFIHYDQGKYTDKGLTAAEAKALSARRTPPIASNHESAIFLHSDLSFLAPNVGKPLNFVVEYHLRPGSLNAFLDYVKSTMLPAARNSGAAAFEVFTTTIGENTDRVLVVTRMDNFATLDHPQVALAEGKDWAKFLSLHVEHVDTYILRYRADLSSVPTAEAAAKP